MLNATQKIKAKKIMVWVVTAILMLIWILVFLYIFKSKRQYTIFTGKYGFKIFFVLFFAALILLCLKLHKKLKGIRLKSVFENITYGLFLLFGAFCMEESVWNDNFLNLGFRYVLLNYALIVIVAICLILMIPSVRAVYIILIVFNYVYGIANHYVLEFKGNPPLFADLFVVQTAATVAGEYDFLLTEKILFCGLTAVFMVVLLIYVKPSSIPVKLKNKKSGIGLYSLRILAAAVIAGCLCKVNLFGRFNMAVDPWSPLGAFQGYGAPTTMYLSMHNFLTKKPEGYSKASALKILNDHQTESEETETQETQQPLVIAIMNESFSDIGVLGDFDSDVYLSYWDSIDSYVMRGNLYMSVCGNGTCNSEFEFLTGCSMANMGVGAYPYTFNDLSEAFNISGYLADEQGYNTIAFHPYYASNWNREVVYQNFGFKTFLSWDDMDTWTNINWGISDKSDYETLERIVDTADDRPQFIFNVTVQNHGGYTDELQTDDLIGIEDKYAAYTDVVNYLTLIRESDRAFEDLISYLRDLDYPVVLCMFGDHQPTLDDNFLQEVSDYSGDSEIERAEQRYITQYIIWSNYDLGVHNVQKDMSVNYLGANLMNVLDYHSAYTDYLVDLQEEIPVINSVGYQTKDGIWHDLSEPNEYLEEYKKVQYYELFEKK